MMKKAISLILIGLIFNAVFCVSSANAAIKDNSEKQAKMAAK